MDTLYDLLGALPHDDAEGLRTAFRRAVKGAHPDLRPGDPDAALKFRQIVRAHEILGDVEERATYDHLLELAHQEQVSASKYAIAATIHKLASGVIALAGASVVTVGGYLLFAHISAASIAPGNDADATTFASPEIAAVSPAEPPAATAEVDAPAAGPASAKITREALAPIPTVPAMPKPKPKPENLLAGNLGLASDRAAREARALRVRGIAAYRNGDLNGAIADLDRALDLDPKFLPAYIDRSIIFYRQRKFDRAFADVSPAKRIEKASRPRSLSVTSRKPRIDQAATARPVISSSERLTAAQDPSREDGFTSAMR
jgi:tetratricopeptide (TPR) repeat protein